MNTSLSPIQSARLQVLLVPLSPIKRSRYVQQVDLIRSFERIALRDISPDPRGERAVLSADPRATGHILLNFIESYSRTHAFLEDVQLSTRIFAIVGIADCEEWENLEDVQQAFDEVLQDHPAVATTRCFAFGSSKDQRKIEGVVTVPRTGDQRSLVANHIAELVSSILHELSNLTVSTPMIEQQNPFDQASATDAPRDSLRSFSFPHEPPSTASSPRSRTLTPPPRSLTPSNLSVTDVSSMNGTLKPKALTNSLRLSINTPDTAALGEKTGKRRTQGRLCKLRGDLQLLAGRPHQAIESEAIMIAKTCSDEVWQGAALEGTIAAQLVAAWLPTVVGTYRPSASALNKVDLSTLAAQPATDTLARDLAAAKETPTKYLQVLQLYAKLPAPAAGDTLNANATNLVLSGDAANPLVFVEACLRCAFLFTTIYTSANWTPGTLAQIVQGPTAASLRPPTESPITLSMRSGVSRLTIADTLAVAWSVQPKLSVPDRLSALSMIAQLYAVIGYRRKRASVLVEMAAVAADALRKQRLPPIETNGTSSKPDVVRSTVDTAGNESIVKLIEAACDVYGIAVLASLHEDGDVKSQRRISSVGGADARSTALIGQSDHFGWSELQIAVVSDAIAIADLLPDHQAGLRFTISALRELSGYMPPMEQLRLSQNIPRIFAAAARRGAKLELDYWGPPDLVMSLQAVSPAPDRIPNERPTSLLSSGTEEATRADFVIYDPKRGKRLSSSRIAFVQHDLVEFVVTLQNPYLFDLEIDSIELSTSGVPFEPRPVHVVIAPGAFQTVRLTGIPLEAGTLTVRGCRVRLISSLDREFLLPCTDDAEDEKTRKRHESMLIDVERIKTVGVDNWQSRKRASVVEERSIKFLECQVVPQQPSLRIISTSLTHGALMLYDGEMTTFSITLENAGALPVDYFDLAFTDTHTSAAQASLREGEMSTMEAFEVEYQLRHRPVFAWQAANGPTRIEAGGRLTVTIECYGKVGCTGGSIQIDYASLAATKPDDSLFHARQLRLDVFMTVHRTLEARTLVIQRLKPLSEPEPSSLTRSISTSSVGRSTADPTLQHSLKTFEEDRHCLLELDVRNVYGQPFEVTLEADAEDDDERLSTKQRIVPGATVTMLVRMDRLQLDAHLVSQPIPPPGGRQFVVEKTDAAEETTSRQLFWYREELLKRLRATWREVGTRRRGAVSLRDVRLTMPMLEVLRRDEIAISLSLDIEEPLVNDFIALRAEVKSALPRRFDALLRFEVLPSDTVDDEAALSRHVLFDGVSHAVLDLQPETTASAELPIVFLSTGRYTLTASIEALDEADRQQTQLWICNAPLVVSVRQ